MLAVLILLLGGAGYTALLVAQDPVRSAPLGLILTATQGLAALAVVSRMPGRIVVAKIVLVLQALAVSGMGVLFLFFTVLPVESMPFLGPAAAHPFDALALVALVVTATVLVPLYVIAFRWLGRTM